jgi:hypothetical protein
MSAHFIDCAQHRSDDVSRALASMLSKSGIHNASEAFTVCELGRRASVDYMIIVTSEMMHEVDPLLSRFLSHAPNGTGVWVFRSTDVEKLLAGWDMQNVELKAA